MFWQRKAGTDYYISKEAYFKNRVNNLVCAARRRAKDRNLPFDIDVEYIISVWTFKCSVLGIEMRFGEDGVSEGHSPSIDRIVPASGYIKGNVRIISYRANALKNNATFEEIEALYKDALRLEGIRIIK